MLFMENLSNCSVGVHRFLDNLKKVSRDTLANKYRCNHIAFIFKGKKILSVGRNSNKTHPKIAKFKYHSFSRVHAELSACIRLGEEDCSKYSIAVLRIDRNGKFNQSCPCEGCKSIINQLGFKKVFYTDENGQWNQLCDKYTNT